MSNQHGHPGRQIHLKRKTGNIVGQAAGFTGSKAKKRPNQWKKTVAPASLL